MQDLLLVTSALAATNHLFPDRTQCRQHDIPGHANDAKGCCCKHAGCPLPEQPELPHSNRPQENATQKVGLGIDELVQGIQRVVATTADHIAAQIAALQEARTVPCTSPLSAVKTPRSEPDTMTSTDPRWSALNWSEAPA